MIKKGILALTAVALISSSAFAADKIEKNVFVGVSDYSTNATNLKDNNIGISIGLGMTKVKDNNLYCGISTDFSYASVENKIGSNVNQKSISIEPRFGYHWNEKSNVYGLVGLRYSDFGSNVNGYGSGFGVGINYKIDKNISAALESKKYFMNTSGESIDSTTTLVKIAYNF